ncbi:5' exonuclease Apollo [Nelusetta ayraudi]|uniref:5' exonuclease Apollo n=1 Tax=Nelusetta ayraudi TaxID=303726 RepID=UPI003F71BF03
MSANGKVIPHTPLAVDFWQVRKCPGTRLFFLSHMHSDHTVGLTSTWSNRPIYCSTVTADLLKLKLEVKEEWIHPLEPDEPYLLPMDDIGKEKLTVTLIDANHCPGSVMFLFQGYFGTILYTGDFRYTPSMLREPCLCTSIDVLYLDNTNCDPNRDLPTRQRATQQIKEIIRSHPDYTIVIGLYSLGKESLLVELAMEFRTWIEVSVERIQTLRVLQLPDVFTTDTGAGRIRVVDQSKVRPGALEEWNKEQPTLAILPTSRPLPLNHSDIHVVPYSDHCSYKELEDFVSALKPTTVLPIVGNYIPGSLSALVPRRKRHEFLVPESVRQYMCRQPKSQVTPNNLQRRHFQSVGPRGVIFESPARGSGRSRDNAWEEESLEQNDVEEEADTETSEKDSDCLVIDLSMDLAPESHEGGSGDTWSINIETVCENESVLRTPNARIHLQPSRSTSGTLKETVTRNAQSGSTASHRRGHGIDQGQDVASDSTGQHIGHEENERARSSVRHVSDPSLSTLTVLRQDYVERIESSILAELTFAE